MTRLLPALMLLCLLASCAADSRGPEAAAPEPDAPERTTVQDRPPAAGTTAREAPTRETIAGGAPTQAGDLREEPESREGPATSSTPTRPALGTNGMVSSAHPLATRAGLGVLEDGGNAFDAAVAVAASLGVVEPYMSGIGGSGVMLVYDTRSGRTRSLSASPRTPASLDPGVFRPPTPGYEANRDGAPTISTPGAVNDWEALWEEHGELSWGRLLEPAVGHAEEGFVLDEENAGWIAEQFYEFPPHTQEIYGRAGAPLAAGQRLVQEDLGRSLRLISEKGADAVYGGPLGEEMASEARQGGGFLTVEDLRASEAWWQEPVGIDYRDERVLTAPTPTTAWNSLTRLGVMGQLDPASLGHNSPDYLRAYAAVTEQAYSERAEYAADPEVTPTPLDRLLSEDYFRQQAAAVEAGRVPSGGSSASASASAAASVGTPEFASAEGPVPGVGHTTHLVVADAEGNVVSMTQSLGDIFGGKVMPEGTGIWLNNGISYSRFEPAGNPLDVYPGRLRLPGNSPVIVLQGGRPRAALGTHGGDYIQQTTAQMIVNLIDFDMDVQRAISEPRIAFLEPNRIAADAGIPVPAQNALAASGYDFFVDEYGMGNAHGLTIEYDSEGRPNRFTGGADPRALGVAAGR